MNQPVAPPLLYRGSQKHKNRPIAERKGTLCPEWTHHVPIGSDLRDMAAHPWGCTQAHSLFQQAVELAGSWRRFATANGIAFEAKPTGDGTWHGYPVPWETIPVDVLQQWLNDKKVNRRQVRKHWRKDEDDLHWAIEADSP